MSKLDKINFKNYLNESNFVNDLNLKSNKKKPKNTMDYKNKKIKKLDDIQTLFNPNPNLDNKRMFDIYDFDKYSEISVPNMKYDKEKLKQINKYKHQYIHGVIHKLDEISNIFQKIGKSIEYFIHYLKESRKILLNNYKDENNDEEIKLLLSYIIKNLYNIIFLELNNLYLNNKKLEYITLENLNIYLIPKIDLLFDEYKINIDITENNRLYKFEVGYNCIECNNEQNIYNILDEAKEIYIYFNTRYNILSSIINQLKLK